MVLFCGLGWVLSTTVPFVAALAAVTLSASPSGSLSLPRMLGRVVDEGVQLHGGYGYMNEYPITKLYTDSRVQRIFGGTSEIMKELISRSL